MRDQNFIFLGRVVQKVDNTILKIVQFVLLTLIHWIAIYPVDSVIQPLNNWGQYKNSHCLCRLSLCTFVQVQNEEG